IGWTLCLGPSQATRAPSDFSLTTGNRLARHFATSPCIRSSSFLRTRQDGQMDETRRFTQLVNTFRHVGCEDSEGWAGSEIREGIPQLARSLLLQSIWHESIAIWQDIDELSDVPAAKRLS